MAQQELKVSTFCKKGYLAHFSHYRQGYLYYNVQGWIDAGEELGDQLQTFCFPIEIKDLDGATVSAVEKSVTLMRYIRKAIADGTMARVRDA